MMARACPMKAFTNRFSGVSAVGLILRSETTSGRRRHSRSASFAPAGESDDVTTAVPGRGHEIERGMRVHSRHGLDPHVPALAAPKPVRLPDDHLEGGKQAYVPRALCPRGCSADRRRRGRGSRRGAPC